MKAHNEIQKNISDLQINSIFTSPFLDHTNKVADLRILGV